MGRGIRMGLITTSTFAGLVVAGAVDLIPGRAASGHAPPLALQFPAGLALGADGSLLVADRRANRVFSVDLSTGRARALVGTGEAGFSGDGGPAAAARLRNPDWVAVAPDGDVLVADTRNHRVRRVDAATGVITTIAGTGENAATGDGGPAVEASLTHPYGLVAHPSGDVYVFDTEAHSVRRIDGATGRIETVLGTGTAGFGGDGGPGRRAQLTRPHNGVLAADGSLLLGDSFNHRIRRWDPDRDVIRTIAGTGDEGTSPPGTPALDASLTYFGALLEEPDGSVLYTGLEGRVMRIRAADWRLEHVAGGEPGGVTFDIPYGMVRLGNGDLVVADAGNGRLVRIDGTTGRATPIVLHPGD